MTEIGNRGCRFFMFYNRDTLRLSKTVFFGVSYTRHIGGSDYGQTLTSKKVSISFLIKSCASLVEMNLSRRGQAVWCSFF